MKSEIKYLYNIMDDHFILFATIINVNIVGLQCTYFFNNNYSPATIYYLIDTKNM